jgi:ABC-type oligopeptide transport system ATPase subunit
MTDDQLQQFKKLLAENNQQLKQDLQQDFQKRLEANNKQLRQEIKEDTKAEVAPLHEPVPKFFYPRP